jgi:hypothetical protein
MSEPINPKMWLSQTRQDFDFFRYPYQNTLKDTIYGSTIRDFSLIDSCMENHGENINFSLAGDIQSEFELNDEATLALIKDELSFHLSNIFQSKVATVSLIDPNTQSNHLWINYQKANEYNPSHKHTGEFSFVIYGDIPESIRQEYKDSKGNVDTRGLIQFQSEFTNDRLNFNPSKGDILIFESSHMHQVYPFYSNETRISIAGNVHEWKLAKY